MAQTRRLTTLILIFAILAPSAICAPQAKAKATPKPAIRTGTVNVVPGVALSLPLASKMKVRWVCPPLSTKAVSECYWYGIHFVVDGKGRPYLGTEYTDIISPTGCYKFTFPRIYEDMICLDNGTFLVATSSDLGFVVPPEKPVENYEKTPVVDFQPISQLPVPRCRLFAGAGGCLYLTGRNPANKLYDVYLLKPEKLTNGKPALREYVKLLSSESEIRAVAGDGATTYLAIDRAILKSTRSSSQLSTVFVDPESNIQSLAYSPQSGLFYATYSGVGYVGSKTNMQLMAADDPDICLQKGSLYVLLAGSLGVVAIDGVADMKKFDLPAKEVPATQSKEVKVTAIRFFEAGDEVPEYPDRKYAKEFQKDSTRFVYCQVDLVNLLKGKGKHKQVVSVDLIYPGPGAFSNSEETTFNFDSDTPDAWGWLRFGSQKAGTFYPGQYTVRTWLNGSQIDERHFTVKGEPSVLEAANYSDVKAMQKLLQNGADPNAVDEDGNTPLMLAVMRSSDENAKLLIQHKADVNAKSKKGQTALLIAVGWYTERASLVRLLLENGAAVNVTDDDSETPLHHAAHDNHVESMRLLLEHKADPNAQDKDGATPLHALNYDMSGSEREAKPETIEMLVARGANPNVSTKKGRSVLEQAIGGHNLLLTKTLIDCGANVDADVKYYDDTIHSLLYWTIVSRQIESDRLSRMEMTKIARLLCDKGATVHSDEVDYVLSTAPDALGRKQIVAALDGSNQATFSFKPTDPWLRKYVLKRIIGLAYSNLANARDNSYYEAALNCAVLAKNRAEEWGMAQEVPEVYFDCGLMAAKTGDALAAKSYLQKYLDLFPNAPNAARARELMSRN